MQKVCDEVTVLVMSHTSGTPHAEQDTPRPYNPSGRTAHISRPPLATPTVNLFAHRDQGVLGTKHSRFI